MRRSNAPRFYAKMILSYILMIFNYQFSAVEQKENTMMINWKPNRKLKESMQSQIFRHFVAAISNGDWPIGTRLPAERKLAEILGVNRSTISSVMDALKAEGVIVSKGSAGTYVANNTWSLLVSNPPPNWNQYMKHSIHKPNQRIIQDINRYEFVDGMIRLGTGELSPDLFPEDLMEEVMGKVTPKLKAMNYEEPQGSYELRCVLADYLNQYHLNLKPEQLLIVSGSLQALQLISIGLLQPGSTVYVESPSYLKSLHLFQSAGMHLKGLAMDDAGIRLKDLRRQIKKTGTNLLYTIPTFHNPTSILMPKERREALIEFVKEYRMPVIEDDAYRELWLDSPPPLPLKSLDDAGNVLYTGSLSKSFSPGIRIGWLAGSQAVVERLGDIKMQTDYGSSSLSQKVAQEWIAGGYYDLYKERLRLILRRKRDVTLQALDANFSDLADWNRPSGGFYIWLRLKQPMNLNQLFDEALKAKLLLNPGHIYDFENNNAIRLSYAYATEEELIEGIEKLRGIIVRLLSQ